jgi:hypothetical protein
MRGAIPPFSQYASMAWCLVKYRKNFPFYLTTAVGVGPNLTLDKNLHVVCVKIMKQGVSRRLSICTFRLWNCSEDFSQVDMGVGE